MFRQRQNLVLRIAIFAVSLISVGCFGDPAGSRTPKNTNPEVRKTPDELEQKLKALKTADFDYIFTFRRKDGEAFDAEDKGIFKLHTYRANRRRLSNDEKVLFVGSNYKFEDKDLKDLKDRFEV